MFRSFYKTKYIAALMCLLVFAVFTLPAHIGESAAEPVKPAYPDRRMIVLDCSSMCTEKMSKFAAEFFSTGQKAEKTRQRYGNHLENKILSAADFAAGGCVFCNYGAVSVPFHTKICALLFLIIITYIFSTDGKKRRTMPVKPTNYKFMR